MLKSVCGNSVRSSRFFLLFSMRSKVPEFILRLLMAVFRHLPNCYRATLKVMDIMFVF